MNIIAVDDEKLALEALMKSIVKAAPEAGLHGFRSPEAVLEYLTDVDRIDVAFLDIETRGSLNGIELARRISDHFPTVNIIFTTGYSEYALDAIKLHCSGYILKPVTAARVREELDKLRNPVGEKPKKRLKIRTFGNFEAFIDGVPISFRYHKTKELLAYLIDRQGSLCRNAEIISILWEDDTDANQHASYLKNLRMDLVNTLEDGGCGDCIIRMRGGIGVLPDHIECDYYDYLNHRTLSSDRGGFFGEYMTQYSWAEYTLAELERARNE